MDNLTEELIRECKEELKIASEAFSKIKRHFANLQEIYGDCEDLIIKLESKLYELNETAPKSKLRKLEEENQNLKNQLSELQIKEKKFAKDVRRDVKESNFDALDILNDL